MPTGWKAGGRQAGTPNKVNSTLHDLVEQEAGAPLPVLLVRIGLKAMKEGDAQLAVNALSRAAVFVYARVAAVDPPTPPADPIHVTIVGPRPCGSCGHDPTKNTHVILPVVHDPLPLP
jgi:hypothetical protein